MLHNKVLGILFAANIIFVCNCGGGGDTSTPKSPQDADTDPIVVEETDSNDLEEPVLQDQLPLPSDDPTISLKTVTLSVRESSILTDVQNDRRENYTTFVDEPVQFATLGNDLDYATWITASGDGVEYDSPISASFFALAYATAIDGSELQVFVNGQRVASLQLAANFESDWYTPIPEEPRYSTFSIEHGVGEGDKIRIMFPDDGPSAASIGSLTFYENESDFIDPPAPLTPGGELTFSSRFLSSITGISYPVTVYLPYRYYETEIDYPVIYVLDGQFHKNHFSYVVGMFGLPAIVVAVDQGPENRRSIDYLAPGVYDYFEFLENELIPFVESNYRASSQNRSITGASASGLAVGFILLNDRAENPVFDNYFSFDAPFYLLNNSYLTRDLANRRNLSRRLDSTVVLVGATLSGDIPPFNQYVIRFRGELINNFTDLDLHYQSYPVNHFNSTGPSWSDFVDLTIE